jgi:hypothetical protein
MIIMLIFQDALNEIYNNVDLYVVGQQCDNFWVLLKLNTHI